MRQSYHSVHWRIIINGLVVRQKIHGTLPRFKWIVCRFCFFGRLLVCLPFTLVLKH